MNRIKVLISAHELSPTQGSECAEGWNLVTRIAKHHDVTVLYAKGSQFSPDSYENAVNTWIAENGNQNNIQFIAVPQPRLTLKLAALNKRISKNGTSIGLPFLYYIGYRLWQKSAYNHALCLLQPTTHISQLTTYNIQHTTYNIKHTPDTAQPFSLLHHLTSISFREPGYLWKLNLPFVWGPTGGLGKVPMKFAADRGLRTLAIEIIRNAINQTNFKFNPRINKAIQKSSLVYTFSTEDQKLFSSRGAKRVELMLDAGCLTRITDNRQPTTDNRLSVLWVGQLIKRKALDILLKAVAGDELLKSNVQITVIGDGPLRPHFEQMAQNLQLTTHNPQLTTRSGAQIPVSRDHNVLFTGSLPREQVFAHMRASDVLVHTSYREATSNVIPEALSCGLPVICHDISGMSIAINGTCGIKVPLTSYKNSIFGFRNALKLITDNRQLTTGNRQLITDNRQLTTDNRQLITSLKSGALQRAKQLSWSSMAQRISEDYNLICSNP